MRVRTYVRYICTGTPEYVAPEMLLGEGVNFGCDWSAAPLLQPRLQLTPQADHRAGLCSTAEPHSDFCVTAMYTMYRYRARWTLGVFAYELMVGKAPFTDPWSNEMLIYESIILGRHAHRRHGQSARQSTPHSSHEAHGPCVYTVHVHTVHVYTVHVYTRSTYTLRFL